MFGDNILDQLGGHIGVANVDLHHVTDSSQRLDLGLDRAECLELAGRNHDRCTETGELMRNASSYAYAPFQTSLLVFCEKRNIFIVLF